MIPSTWLSVVFFLFLVAPGVCFDLLAERRRAGLSESAFREASRIVLASTCFSSVGFLVLALLRASAPSWMPDPGDLLGTEGHSYLATHYRLILRALLSEAGVALAAACLCDRLLSRNGRAHLRSMSTWTRVIRQECPAGHVPHVRLRLASGAVYVGRVADFTADLDPDGRELILMPPLFSKTGTQPLADMPSEWQRLIVSGSAVETLAVQYRPPPSGDPSLPAGRPRWRRVLGRLAETVYLLRSLANAERLRRSLADARAGTTEEHDLLS